MAAETQLSATDHLKLQLAAVTAEKAQALARVEVLKFEAEVLRISAAYGLTAADSVDVKTGTITRAPGPT